MPEQWWASGGDRGGADNEAAGGWWGGARLVAAETVEQGSDAHARPVTPERHCRPHGRLGAVRLTESSRWPCKVDVMSPITLLKVGISEMLSESLGNFYLFTKLLSRSG